MSAGAVGRESGRHRRLGGTIAGAMLAFFVIGAVLERQAVEWDGLAFLTRARTPVPVELGHALFPSVLRVALGIGEAVGLAPESAARRLSTLAGALSLGALLLLLLDSGVRLRVALPAALLVVTSPAFFRASVSVEAYAFAVAAWLWACVAARRYAASRRGFHLMLAAAALMVAAGTHVAALLGGIAVAAFARGRGAPVPVRHLLGIVLVGVLFGVVLVALDIGGRELRRLVEDIRGFLPNGTDSVGGFVAGLGRNAEIVRVFFMDEAPVLAVAGLAGVVGTVVLRGIPRAVLAGMLVPWLAVFVALGVPLLGLLLPAFPGLGLGFALGDRLPGRAGRAWAWIAWAALLVSVLLAAPRAFADARDPDPLRQDAALVARAVPPGSLIVAGRIAQHLRYYEERPVVAIDEIYLRRRSLAPKEDPVETLHRAIAPWTIRGARVYLESHGAERLFIHSLNVYPTQEAAFADLSRRLLTADPPLDADPGHPGRLRVFRLRVR